VAIVGVSTVGVAIVGVSTVGTAAVGVVTADGAPAGESLSKLQQVQERIGE
jgi:hypothetical protein